MADRQFGDLSNEPEAQNGDEFFGDGDPTILQSLEKVLQEESLLDPIVIPVKAHAGVKVRYDINIDADTMNKWRRRWTNKRTQDIDILRFSCTVVASQAQQIIFRGQEPHDSDGHPLTFRSRDVARMVGVQHDQPAMVVQKFFKHDPHIIATSNVIMEQAGYSMDEDDLLDPTNDESNN